MRQERLRRVAWFVGLWLAGVLALGVVTLLLRLAISMAAT